MLFVSPFQLSGLAAGSGFAVSGAASSQESGYSVKNTGDVNGDGHDDLIIGAPQASPNGVNSGASYVVFGTASGSGTIDLANIAAGNGGFVIQGEAAGD